MSVELSHSDEIEDSEPNLHIAPATDSRIRVLTSLTRQVVADAGPQALMHEAIQGLIRNLGGVSGTIMEVRGDQDLVRVAKFGRLTPSVVPSKEGGNRCPLVTYTLESDRPVVVKDARVEGRFDASGLETLGIVGALGVRIPVPGAAPRILSICATEAFDLSASDLEFVQTVSNLLGMGLQRLLPHQDRPASMEQLAGLAHDLNNVVAAVGIYSEMLVRDEELSLAGTLYVSAIRDQVQRGSSLLWHMLDVANRSPLELDDLDVVAVLRQAAPLLRRSLPPGVTLVIRDDGHPCWARIDRVRFLPVIMNLVSNAKDAVDGGGEITLSITRQEKGSPLARPSVRVEVADTGTGMDGDLQDRAFDAFFTTKVAGEGIGLGLAQVRSLVHQHHGSVQIASAPGQGTTLTIWLPASDRLNRTFSAGRPDMPRGHGERVLVVDDDRAIRTAIVSVLNSLGYSPVDASSGEDACSVLSSDPSIAVVISDIRMPGMGGESLVKEMARQWPAIPVVLVSGYPSPLAERPFVDAGAGAAGEGPQRLQKPFTSLQIATAMSAALRCRS
jgi:signal transduction histidine kinase/ActR/RegA family two-component response regulator